MCEAVRSQRPITVYWWISCFCPYAICTSFAATEVGRLVRACFSSSGLLWPTQEEVEAEEEVETEAQSLLTFPVNPAARDGECGCASHPYTSRTR